MRHHSPFSKSRILIAVVAVVIVASLTVWLTQHKNEAVRSQTTAAPAASPALSSGAASKAASPAPQTSKAGPSATAEKAKTFSWFARRPFAVVKESKTDQWTAEDGLSPDFIYKVAHNELEVERMVEENDQIKRRQLVYRKETVPMLLQRSAGQPLKSLELPGLDGQEIEVEVTETNLHGLEAGSVNGRVKGRFNSLVSVGFSNGCESYNVISPDDGLYLAADAREPGEVVVKEIDPAKYKVHPQTDVPDFILTNQPVPGQKPSPTPSK